MLCMIFARNAAMAFNRLVDKEIDAKNPRTANRELPKNIISSKKAILIIENYFFIIRLILRIIFVNTSINS